MIVGKQRDGFYDEEGNWQRTKFCFTPCPPESCTCSPPKLHLGTGLGNESLPWSDKEVIEFDLALSKFETE